MCLTFGRNEHQCDIALAHQSISRQHAAIVHDRAGNVQLLDLGSTHGTFAGGRRLEQHVPLILKEGDVLTFGGSKREYKVRLGAGASQVAAENEARGSFLHRSILMAGRPTSRVCVECDNVILFY